MSMGRSQISAGKLEIDIRAWQSIYWMNLEEEGNKLIFKDITTIKMSGANFDSLTDLIPGLWTN